MMCTLNTRDQDLCNTQGDTAVCPGTATENYGK